MSQHDEAKGYDQQEKHGTEGWYLYDGKEVTGPFSDMAMRDQYSNDETKIFASKKGFSKWYTLNEVRSFFGEDQEKLNGEILAFKHLFESNLKQLEELVAPPKVKEAPIRKVEPTRIATTIEQSMMEETIRGVSLPEEQKESDLFQPGSFIPDTNVRRKIKDPAKPTKPKNPKELYMVLRGRLRLGDVKSSFDASVIHYFLSLSISSFFWYRRVRQELNFHTTGKFSRGRWHDIFILVPVLNTFKFYALAKLVKEAELQNHYTLTKPWKAFVYSFIPPFAVSHLQHLINKHWMLHVLNVKKKQEGKK